MSGTRLLCIRLLTALSLLGTAVPVAGQSVERPNQLALDVSVLGATLSYARHTGPNDLAGFMVGGAGLWAASEHFSGDHFDSGDLLGLAHGGGFWRHQRGEHFEIDVGIRIGAVIHGSDEGNAGLALMGGPYVQPMVGWRSFKVGPRLIGAFVWEGPDANGIGLLVDPIAARVMLRF